RRLIYHLAPDLPPGAVGGGGRPPPALARVVGWRNEIFDRRVASRVRRERPDFVVGHDGSALLAGRAARRIGAIAVLNQVIGHIADGLDILRQEAALSPEFADGQARVPAWIVERCHSEALEADAILAPSAYVRDTLLGRGVNPARILVLPYGVDVERFRPPPERRRDGVFRILFVGNLAQRKGIKYLLEAVRRLKLKDAELVLVGKLVATPAALAPYRDLFRHVPHVPHADVHALYGSADLFVYPSLHEGSAFATYEALASGLPVIATANTGSVVRDGQEGIIVPLRDPEALARAIERLYRDQDLRAAMARAARARALEFTWAHYRARLCGHFEALWARRAAT
ncbi:MAG: glycosyltransferase family 4 protein, partial [Pseudomonadota bacterium]